jgi:outer membrane lipoprotein carrier protein
MKKIFFLAALFAAGAAIASSLEHYQTFLNGTQSARAAFEQKVYDRDGRLVQNTKGSFVFQRPGRFRWIYDKPADQVIVGDGQRVWIYDRQLNQVTVRKVARALGATPAALLAGGTGIEASFELSDAGKKDGLEWMEAKPREKEAGFERVRMGFSAEGLAAMELTDHFGQVTRLRFTNLVRNPKVDAAEFRFDPPKGADVLGDK